MKHLTAYTVNIRYLLIFMILGVLLCSGIQTVSAGETVRSVSELSVSEKKSEGADIEFSDSECNNKAIDCYAVGDNNIALGLTDYINVYDLNGSFLYSIKCNMSSACFLEYVEDDLYLYLLRSSECIKITGYLKPVSYFSVDDTKSNDEIISYKLKNRNSDIVKDSVTYQIRGINSTKLVKINGDSTETVIYDSTKNVWLKFIVVSAGVVIFAFVILFDIISRSKNNIEKEKSYENPDND